MNQDPEVVAAVPPTDAPESVGLPAGSASPTGPPPATSATGPFASAWGPAPTADAQADTELPPPPPAAPPGARVPGASEATPLEGRVAAMEVDDFVPAAQTGALLVPAQAGEVGQPQATHLADPSAVETLAVDPAAASWQTAEPPTPPSDPPPTKYPVSVCSQKTLRCFLCLLCVFIAPHPPARKPIAHTIAGGPRSF